MSVRQDDIGESTVTLGKTPARPSAVSTSGWAAYCCLPARLPGLAHRNATLAAAAVGHAARLAAGAGKRPAGRSTGRPRTACQRDHDDPDRGAVHAACRLIAGAVAAQAAQLLQKFNGRAPQAADASALDLAQRTVAGEPLEWLGQHAGISIVQVQDWLVAAGKHVLQFLASSGGTFVLGALGTLVSFLLMLFVLFFVLRDGPALAQKVVRMLPIEERMRGKLWQHLKEVTRAVFMGIGVTALVQGMLVGIGFWIAGLPSALVFGVLAALFALVPLVGTVVVWGPGALFL